MDSLRNGAGTAPVPKRVLCAEDHAQMSDLLAKVLTRAGHHVVCTADGAEALARALQESFDVIVTDHNMPHTSGLEFVTRLREVGFPGKIVIHTSRLTPEAEAEYRRLEVDAILLKPGGILKIAGLVSA